MSGVEVVLNGMVVRPGDTLILHLESDQMTDQVRADLRAQVKGLLPGLAGVVFLEGLAAAGVYRPAEAADA